MRRRRETKENRKKRRDGVSNKNLDCAKRSIFCIYLRVLKLISCAKRNVSGFIATIYWSPVSINPSYKLFIVFFFVFIITSQGSPLGFLL